MFLAFFLSLIVSSVSGLPQVPIFGGENATRGEFPIVASLQLRGRHRCGASVLDKRWLLTTARCVDVDTSELTVVAGSVDLSSGGARHTVATVTVHSQYNATDSWSNDIALVRVDPELVIDNTNIAIAELVAKGQDTTAGTPAIVVGWGNDAELAKMQDVLQKVNMEIVDQQRCIKVYSTLNKIVWDTEICAKVPEADKGPCRGDSGSPLLVEGVVVAVSSWQRGCGQGWPAVYTRVASYLDWIADSKSKLYSRFL